MKQPCGCCAGIEIVTPALEANRPGLSALVYRAGTFATFLETMVARLSSFYLDVTADDGTGKVKRLYPLRGLTTRAAGDPSIALLDAWATVADVLTFYQERIANEGFLRTATERLSVLELARLVGYRLRPGVSASVYLGFTVTAGFDGIIPQGTRAQSIPNAGQKPQFFESYEDLPARDAWNAVKPRLTRPQVITLGNDSPSSDPTKQIPFEPDFDARTRDTLYFQGISTNLKVGDSLLIVAGTGFGQQAQRFIVGVNPQPAYNRTEVVLQEPPPVLVTSVGGSSAARALATLNKDLGPFVEGASSDFPDTEMAAQAASILNSLMTQAASAESATEVGRMVEASLPEIEKLHEIAVTRQFTRLEPWLADLINTMDFLIDQLPTLDGEGTPGGGVIPGIPETIISTSSLSNLESILDSLAQPPSLQPANSIRLKRTVSRTFAPASDMAPRLIATLRPAVAPLLYPAWANVRPAANPTPVQVYALRSKTAPFGNNAPLQPNVPAGSSGGLVGYQEWTFAQTDLSNRAVLFLESANDKIVPGSWIVVQRADSKAPQPQPLITTISNVQGSVQSVSRADYLMSAKVTQLTLSEAWINDVNSDSNISALRQATVWVQAEELALAEEPLDRDLQGDRIELDGLYDGLESGRWIIVSGNRTDIPNVSGVGSSELVMIASVNQGPGKESCLPFTTTTVPFTQVYYVTEPDSAGDRLVVGEPANLPSVFLQTVPVPSAPNQQICDPIQLAPGFYANAYVPTSDERQGIFTAFAATLLDPVGNNSPFGGVIPPSRMDPTDPNNPAAVYAWRIGSLARGSDTPHTTIVLANKLSYQYDAENVTIYGNVVKATHGQTQGEVLGDGDSSQALQKFPLHQSPLTYLPVPTPSGAESTLTVRVNEVEWHEADNLFVLGPTDRDYISTTDDNDITTVITGTGAHGLRVPTGTANVKAVYRSGTGKAGNVDAQQISQLATQPLGAKSVLNPLPAAGGADGDTRDQARRNVPIGTLALDRLVSVSDYADFARKFAGIGKASSRRLSDGRKILVHLTIAGKDDIPIDPTTDLYQALQQALLAAGDPHQPIQIVLRRLRVLVMSAGVKILPDYRWETIAANLRAALLNLYSFDNRELGQSAFLSEAVSTMQSIAGVQYVDMRTFDSVGEGVTAQQLVGLASTLGLNPFVSAELAHVDLIATDPSKRILPAELAILTPDIPDTLILTEITT